MLASAGQPLLAWEPVRHSARTSTRAGAQQHPEGVQGLPGYVWLDMPRKVRSVGEHEFTDDPLTPAAEIT
jgi:hypothetical protein